MTGFEEDDEMPSGPPGEHWQEFEPWPLSLVVGGSQLDIF